MKAGEERYKGYSIAKVKKGVWVKGLRIGEGDQADIFNITQKIQNTSVHLKVVDEEQWKTTKRSKPNLLYLSKYCSTQMLRISFLSQALKSSRTT